MDAFVGGKGISAGHAVDQQLHVGNAVGLQKLPHALRVAYAHGIGRDDQYGAVRGGAGIAEAAPHAGRTVEDHVIEAALEFSRQRAHILGRYGGRTRLLGSGQQEEIFAAAVAVQRLFKRADALHHVHEIVYHVVFRAQHQIQRAEADVHIDQQHAPPAEGETGREVSCGRGLAHAALTGGDYDGFSHCVVPFS